MLFRSTAFRVEVTKLVEPGRSNLLAVKLDTSENPSIPPFGFVVDYLTYGGLYREAWLDVRENGYITDIYVTTPTLTTANVKVATDGAPDGAKLEVSILDSAGKTVWAGAAGKANVPDARPWDTARPDLYRCVLILFINHMSQYWGKANYYSNYKSHFYPLGLLPEGKIP